MFHDPSPCPSGGRQPFVVKAGEEGGVKPTNDFSLQGLAANENGGLKPYTSCVSPKGDTTVLLIYWAENSDDTGLGGAVGSFTSLTEKCVCWAHLRLKW